MALANIFTRLTEIESKLQQVNTVGAESNTDDLDALVARVSALENQSAAKLQDVIARVMALESKQIPPDVSGKVAMLETKLQQIEAKVVDTKPFLEKLNKIESVTLAELKTRVAALEEKLTATPA